jgi:release factor glutamine methyltransferase
MDQAQISKETWTVLSLLQWTTQYLSDNEIDSPRLTAELLLANLLHCDRIRLYTNHDLPLRADELVEFKRLLKRRLTREPLQYIVGETEFMGLRFKVNKHVLIPRPETEILVEQCLMILREKPRQQLRILDIGTGSGNIAISMAKLHSGAFIDTIDISSDALKIARENSDLNGTNNQIAFYELNILDPKVRVPFDRYDLIVSNPPYISSQEFEQLQPEVRLFEPMTATTDGGDGLSFYRVIAGLSIVALAPDGIVAVEMAYDQQEAVRQIFSESGFVDIRTVPDYAGILRILIAQKR